MSSSHNNRHGPGEPARGESVTPGLTLVIGPPNSGKMGWALRWWQERLELDPVVVAPTSADAQQLTQEMLRRTGVLVGRAPAMTFDGLVSQVLGGFPRYVDNFKRDLILQRILLQETLPALRVVAAFSGTLTALAALLRRLEESGRSVAEISAMLQRWALLEPAEAALASDIARVVARYEQQRSDFGLTDRPAAVRMARERLREWTRPVVFYGFTSFTGGQRALVEDLCSRVPVVLTLAFEEADAVSVVQSSEAARWRRLGVSVVELPPQQQAYSSPEIAFLERHFMRMPPNAAAELGGASNAAEAEVPRPAATVAPHPEGIEVPRLAETGDGSTGVMFLLASGQRNEAELAAERVAELLRRGFSPGRIAIVVRNIGAWDPILSQVFRSCNIPVRIDSGRRLRNTGLGHAVLSALEGWLRDDGEALLAYLRSPYSGLDLPTVAEVEVAYRGQPQRGTPPLVALLEQESWDGLARLQRIVVRREDGMYIDVPSLERLMEAMLACGLRDVALTSAEAEDDARCYVALRSATSALTEMSRSGSDSEWLVSSVVMPALERLVVPAGPVEGQEAVQVLTPERARARRFDALFVLGLVDGEFPAIARAPALLSERQRARLDSLGGGELLPREVEAEAALFAGLLSRPWQALYLSARDADDDGSEVAPSPFWQESMRVLGSGVASHHRRTLATQVFPPHAAPTERHFRRACALRARSCPGFGAVLDSAAPAGNRAAVVTTRWEREQPSLRHPHVRADLAAREWFSPSELERYLGCPLGWFLERIVGVDRVEAALDSKAVGELAHSALCSTYRTLKETGDLPVRPGNLAHATAIVLATIDSLVDSRDCRGNAAEKRTTRWLLKRILEATLAAESMAESDLVPDETEVKVGGDHGVDIGGFSLRGKIDRVDASSDRRTLFVIDYKTGSVPAKSAIGTSEGLQLPLYLMALAQERPGTRVIGGAYLGLADQQWSGVIAAGCEGKVGAAAEGCRVLDVEGEEALLAQTLQTALAAVEGIRQGRIAPPPGQRCPLWCRLGPACRSRVGASRP